VAAPPPIGYRNPLDTDGGAATLDGGAIDGGGATWSEGVVDGRRLDLNAAVYLVSMLDGGQPRTELTLGDVAGLCAFAPGAPGDGGTTASFDLLRIRLEGDVPGTYLVSLAVSPDGATAALQYQSDAGAFGTAQALSGAIDVYGIDPGNNQPAQGAYTVTFSATESISGRFLAEPCAGLAPPPGG